MKCAAKCTKCGGFGWLGVTLGHRQCHHSMDSIWFPIRLSLKGAHKKFLPFSSNVTLWTHCPQCLVTDSHTHTHTHGSDCSINLFYHEMVGNENETPEQNH